jgi:hypothetical protein
MTDGNIKRLWRQLKAGRWPPPPAGVAIRPGVYALFLNEPKALPGFNTGDDGLIYVGMTADTAGGRNHFAPPTGHSGFSSPRRSLGAALLKKLKLRAIPRSAGSSSTNWTNYRFSDGGEAALTRWMRRNLSMSHVCLPGGEEYIERIEKQLIAYLKPPLNLTGFPGGSARKMLRQLRKACREEARAFSGVRK